MLVKQKRFSKKKTPNRSKSAVLRTLIWWVYFCPVLLTLLVSVWGFFLIFCTFVPNLLFLIEN